MRAVVDASNLQHVVQRFVGARQSGVSFRFPPVVSVHPAAAHAHAEIVNAHGTAATAPTYGAFPTATQFHVESAESLRKALRLGDRFSWHGTGAAVSTAATEEGLLLALASARARASVVRRGSSLRLLGNSSVDSRAFVAYCHPQQLPMVTRVAHVAGYGVVRPFTAPYDPHKRNYFAFANELELRFEEDIARGLLPCAVIGTYGTSATCAVDPIAQLRAVTRKHQVWLHVDASLGWSTGLVDPQFGHAVTPADSVSVDPSLYLGWAPAGHGVTWFAHRESCAAAFGPALSTEAVEDASLFPSTLEVRRLMLNNQRCTAWNALHWCGLHLALGLDRWLEVTSRHQELSSSVASALQADGRYDLVSHSLATCTFRHLQAVDYAEYHRALLQRGYAISTTRDSNGNVLCAVCVAGDAVDDRDVKGLLAAIDETTTALRAPA